MGDQYTVVVALAYRDTVGQLVRTAADIARVHDGRIYAVTVEHKPVSSPFLVFSDESVRAQFSGDRPELLDAAVDAVDVPITTDLLVGSDVGDAIRAAVDDVDGDVLLLGWQEKPNAADIVLGSTVDSLIRRPPCDVLVERIGKTTAEVDRVLVPTVGEPHLTTITETARSIALANDVSITVLSVLGEDPDDTERERGKEVLDRASEAITDVPVERRIVEATSSEAGILDVAEPTDVVVMGATGTGLVRPSTIGSVAWAVGTEAPCPVIIAKEAGGSRLQQFLSRL